MNCASPLLLAWLVLAGCGPAGPAPVQPTNAAGIDPSALTLLHEKIREVEGDRGSAFAHGQLGLTYEANKMWSEAAASFANAAQLDGSDSRWPFHRAIAMHNFGALEEALELYDTLSVKLATSATYRHRFGDALLQNGQAQESIVHFDQVIRLEPNQAEGFVGRGGARYHLKQYNDAVTDLEKAVALDPGYRSAHYLLGLSYRELGRRDDARRELGLGVDGKIRYLPDEFNELKKELGVGYGTRMERALVLFKSGKNTEAVKVLEELSAAYADNTDVLNNLASGYRRLGQDQRALGLLKRVHKLDPKQFPTLINLAAVRLDVGDLRGALADAQQAVALAPEHRSTQMILGQVLSRMGKLPEARAALERSLELGATADGQNLLGETCASMQDFASAMGAFEEAIRLDPAHLPALLNLCRMHLFQGRMKEAEAAFAAAKRIAPGNPQVNQMAGDIEERKRGS